MKLGPVLAYKLTSGAPTAWACSQTCRKFPISRMDPTCGAPNGTRAASCWFAAPKIPGKGQSWLFAPTTVSRMEPMFGRSKTPVVDVHTPTDMPCRASRKFLASGCGSGCPTGPRGAVWARSSSINGSGLALAGMLSWLIASRCVRSQVHGSWAGLAKESGLPKLSMNVSAEQPFDLAGGDCSVRPTRVSKSPTYPWP